VQESARLVAPQGFEPRYAAPEAAVLPLNEGAMRQTGKAGRSLTLPILKAGSTQVNVRGKTGESSVLLYCWWGFHRVGPGIYFLARRSFRGNRKEDMLSEHELQNGLNDRRSFIKLMAAAPLFAAIGARSLANTVAANTGKSFSANIYTRLAVRPFINGRGTWTYLSGSPELPELRQATGEASQILSIC
jgi:hypothetical protein